MSNNLKLAIEEFLKHRYTDKHYEIMSKYPNLWDNDNIRSKLLVRYPMRRMTDAEYRQMWVDELNRPSFIGTLPKEQLISWEIQVPLLKKDKEVSGE